MKQMMTESDLTNILIVDDKEENLLSLEGWLENPRLNIVKARSGNEALARLIEHDFALVLLDVQMPGMNGFETAELMQGTERTKGIPIIFVTAISKEEKHVFKGYETGAVDYISKPFDPYILKSKVWVFVNLHRQSLELKRTIEKLRKANEKNEYLSTHDPLTGCFNRGYLNEKLPTAIKRSLRYKRIMSLIMTDIDHFKKVNDTHGHQGGDEVLKAFVEILTSITRKDIDWLARFGGEEFVLVLPETDLTAAAKVAEKLRQAVAETPIIYDGSSIGIKASFGVASFDESDADPFESSRKLLYTADQRLYAAKNQGRNRVVLET